MKLFSRIFAFIAAMILAASAFGQAYPTNTPTYLPTAVLASKSLTAPGTVTFNSQGNAEMYIRFGGTNTGFAATVSVSESRSTSATFTQTQVQNFTGVPGPLQATIIANGLYKLTIAGAAQVQVNVTSITGTNVTIAMSATVGGPEIVQNLPVDRFTYSLSATITPAASTTDFLVITGSATTTVRVTSVLCTGTSTAAGVGTIAAIKRSTADTGGTSSAVTAVPNDTINPAAGSSTLVYTANPASLGTSVGTMKVNHIVTVPASSTAVPPTPISWQFGWGPSEQEVVLRGTSQVFALNGTGASFPSGTSLNCSLTITEE